MKRPAPIVNRRSAVPASSLLLRPARAIAATGGLLLAAAVSAAADPNQIEPVEPLSPLYLIFLALVTAGIFFGLYWYYMRGNDEKDQQDSRPE